MSSNSACDSCIKVLTKSFLNSFVHVGSSLVASAVEDESPGESGLVGVFLSCETRDRFSGL